MTWTVDDALWDEARREVIDGGLRIDGFGQVELRRRTKTSTGDPAGTTVRVDVLPTFVADPVLVAAVAGHALPATYDSARLVAEVAARTGVAVDAVRERLDATVRGAVRDAIDRARPRPRPLGTLGIFHVRDYPAYETRNPRGGDPIQVPAKRVAAFAPSRTPFTAPAPAPAPGEAVDAALAAWNGEVAMLATALATLGAPLSPADQIRVIDHVADRLGDGWLAASDDVVAALPT